MQQDSKVYSFSAKNKADVELIEAIKRENAKLGRKFSWVVLEALKQWAESDEANRR